LEDSKAKGIETEAQAIRWQWERYVRQKPPIDKSKRKEETRDEK
jgi:hypothetical protein